MSGLISGGPGDHIVREDLSDIAATFKIPEQCLQRWIATAQLRHEERSEGSLRPAIELELENKRLRAQVRALEFSLGQLTSDSGIAHTIPSSEIIKHLMSHNIPANIAADAVSALAQNELDSNSSVHPSSV